MNLDQIETGKFPRDIRTALSKIIALFNMEWKFQPAEDLSPNSWKVIKTEENITFIVPRSIGGGTNNPPHPFQILNASEDGTAKARVVMGRINQLVPWEDGPFNEFDDPPFIIDVEDGDTIYVIVEMAYDTSTYWSATGYDIDTEALNDSTHASYPLGTVAVNDDTVTAVIDPVAGNIGMQRCGGSDSVASTWWAGP